jgi:hypothetical protein
MCIVCVCAQGASASGRATLSRGGSFASRMIDLGVPAYYGMERMVETLGVNEYLTGPGKQCAGMVKEAEESRRA